MKKESKSFRSDLGRARGLGSAKSGTGHWMAMRLTAVILVPLSIYVILTFFNYVVYGGYDGALYWMRSPFTATFLILFLAAGFHHAANGTQEVIEDYVHCECAKIASIVAVKFVAAICALLGILAVVKVLFGV